MKKLYLIFATIFVFTITIHAQTDAPLAWTDAPLAWYNTEVMVESFPFASEGKNYTMAYYTHKSDMKEICEVYFFPDGYDKDARENVEPPMFEKLILHDLGDDNKNFAGVWTSEVKIIGEFPSTIYREIRLPDDIANKLIDMLYGDYKLPPNKYLKKDCVKKVFDSKLLPTEVIRDYY